MTKKKCEIDKKARGRPTVMTKETVAKLEEAFLMGCSDLEACLYANIDKATLYRYQGDNPEFCDRKELLKNSPTLNARKVISEALELNDKDVAKWYLERKCKDEFSTKQETTSTVKTVYVTKEDEAIVNDHISEIIGD